MQVTKYKVKIYGAGSVGNHLANAARQLGWDVTVVDNDPKALDRMRQETYPNRYGNWDPNIKLMSPEEGRNIVSEAVLIGTPPDSHVPIALSEVKEGVKFIMLEKPLCPPDANEVLTLIENSKKSNVPLFVGYNHSISEVAQRAYKYIEESAIGKVQWIDVEWREHWQGIFNAHPWLDGPQDSYLGHWKRGGGAGGEHSHGLNLLLKLVRVSKLGCISEVSSSVQYSKDGSYDESFMAQLKTESGALGRIVQDVITKPARKRAFVQGSQGSLEIIFNKKENTDSLIFVDKKENKKEQMFSKTRPQDFITELKFLDKIRSTRSEDFQTNLEDALKTIQIIQDAHKNNKKRSPNGLG